MLAAINAVDPQPPVYLKAKDVRQIRVVVGVVFE